MVPVSHTQKTDKAPDALRALRIKHVAYAGMYKLHVSFDNGVDRIIDIKPYLDVHAHVSMYNQFYNLDLFTRFTYNPHFIDWGNVITLHPIDLYLNTLIHPTHDIHY